MAAVGEVVIFTNAQGVEQAAIVTGVNPDGTNQLTVFSAETGESSVATRVDPKDLKSTI